MSKEYIHIIIPGEPTAQGRPKFSTKGGFVKAYDPAKSRDYKALLKLIAIDEGKKQEWRFRDKEPLCISIIAKFPIAKTKSKKFRQAALERKEMPTKRPDTDNIIKIVQDAFQGILYKEDSQFVMSQCVKVYSVEPCVEVTISEWNTDI